MKMPKPTDADRERFTALVPGLFGADVGLKLPPEQQQELQSIPGSGPFGPAERPMGGYVTTPADWTATEARPGIEKSFASVAALPPKRR